MDLPNRKAHAVGGRFQEQQAEDCGLSNEQNSEALESQECSSFTLFTKSIQMAHVTRRQGLTSRSGSQNCSGVLIRFGLSWSPPGTAHIKPQHRAHNWNSCGRGRSNNWNSSKCQKLKRILQRCSASTAAL